WLNRLVKSGSQAFDVELFKTRVEKREPTKGALITIGFDGSQTDDATGIVATEIATGFQWVAGSWECPPGGADLTPRWRVPVQDVDDVMRALFKDFEVWRLYADPPFW